MEREVIVKVKLRAPTMATDEQVVRYVEDALGSVHYGYGDKHPFYGFDDDCVQVLEVIDA